MSSTKKLKGIPNTIIQQFFSTLFYFSKGYMADWIWNAANEKNIKDISVDIYKRTVEPKSLEIKPIVTCLDRIEATIKKELTSNNFDLDFITEATFHINIPESKSKLLNIHAELVDKNGKHYKSREYTEMSYEKDFKVFNSTPIEKIKKLFTNKRTR